MTAVTEPEARDATLTIRPLQPTIGAEISGVDLRNPLSDAERDQIKAAILQYKVVFFRDQFIDQDQHAAFARRFGQAVHPPDHQEPRREDRPHPQHRRRRREEYAQHLARQQAEGWALPHRHELAAGADLGRGAARGEPARRRRRHDLGRRRARLRRALRRRQAAPRGTARHPRLPRRPGRRRPRLPDRGAPGRAHPPRDRQEDPVGQLHRSTRTSSASTWRRAGSCSRSGARPVPAGPSSRCGSAGARARSRSGTTARRSTTPSATTATSRACLSAS